MLPTSPGISATTQVTAVRPNTPCAEKVFRSAWMPAPAEQSEPAMLRAMGGVLGMICDRQITLRQRHAKNLVLPVSEPFVEMPEIKGDSR